MIVVSATVDENVPNPFDTPGARQLVVWTLRLAEDPMFGSLISSDPHLFAMMYASCASATEPPEALRPIKVADQIRMDGEGLLSMIKDLQREFGERISGQFGMLYRAGIALHERYADMDVLTMMSELSGWRSEIETELDQAITHQEANLDRLAALIELNPVERDLLAVQLNRSAPGFQPLFNALLRPGETTTWVLATMLGVSIAEISAALDEDGKLASAGLLTVRSRPVSVDVPSPHLQATIAEPAATDEEFIKRFVRPLSPSSTTASLARIDDRDREILIKLMRIDPPVDQGLHALVYGPKSIDKRGMLATLFEDEDISAYHVVTRHVPGTDLPAWVTIAQQYIEFLDDKNAVLVVERADQVLASQKVSFLSLFGEAEDTVDGDDERASDAGLTGVGSRCVWLTDQPRSLTEQNLGRFLFHCEARPGSRADRRERITSVIDEFDLSKDLEHHLARYSLLGDKQVRSAATLARLLGGDHADRDHIIRRAVHQSQRSLGRERTEELRDSVTNYSLDNLNLAGRFAPQQIIKALRERPHGSLCFWGLPGSGKTQLAEFMAVELDLPIIMKRASDLLSKWLGESEQNIAAMFREAEEEGAILLLDEADSFLRDRSLARAEWSVTQVNELLQQMERFDGIFIAATNLFQDLDAASLRRFTWKLEFLPLSDTQVWSMFVAETGFAEKRARKRAQQLRENLLLIPDLTPGDFATVKRQATMLGDELDENGWIEQLAVESKAKMSGLKRHRLGFGARDGEIN
jgi:hypothetical protein